MIILWMLSFFRGSSVKTYQKFGIMLQKKLAGGNAPNHFYVGLLIPQASLYSFFVIFNGNKY